MKYKIFMRKLAYLFISAFMVFFLTACPRKQEITAGTAIFNGKQYDNVEFSWSVLEGKANFVIFEDSSKDKKIESIEFNFSTSNLLTTPEVSDEASEMDAAFDRTIIKTSY